MTHTNHGLDRKEWERRFAARIETRADLQGAPLDEVVKAELESWPEEGDPLPFDDWRVNLPEEAADEQMSNWCE